MKKYLIFFCIFFLIFSFIPISFVKGATSITYNAVSNIITVTGFPSDSPCSFWDLYNASNINGWNIVKMFPSDNVTFEFGCRIIIGGISTHTYFIDKNIHITFNSTSISANGHNLIEVKYRGHFTLGQLDNATTKLTSRGVSILAVNSGYTYNSIIYGQHSSADIKLYSCSFISTSPNSGSLQHRVRGLKNNTPVYNCLFNNVYLELSSVDGFRITMLEGDCSLSRSTGTFEDIYLEAPFSQYIYWYGSETGNLKNIKGIGNKGAYGDIRCLGITVNHNITNGDFDRWRFNWGGSATGEVYRNYEFDLTVTYPNGTVINGTLTGARVEIQHFGNNSGIDYNATLNEDGSINQTILSMGFYNQTGDDNIYNYNPFNLRIYNVTGYVEYNGNFTLNKKEDLTISLISYANIDYTLPIALLISFGVICILLIIAKIKR